MEERVKKLVFFTVILITACAAPKKVDSPDPERSPAALTDYEIKMQRKVMTLSGVVLPRYFGVLEDGQLGTWDRRSGRLVPLSRAIVGELCASNSLAFKVQEGFRNWTVVTQFVRNNQMQSILPMR